MHIRLYTYIYMYVYIYEYTYIHIYIYINKYRYICMHIHIYMKWAPDLEISVPFENEQDQEGQRVGEEGTTSKDLKTFFLKMAQAKARFWP